jgi:hypothetical protein
VGLQHLTKCLIGWIGLNRVNLIKHLFGRHQQAQGTPFPFISWAGQSGTEYLYEIYPICTPFRPQSGNYIYAKQSADGSWIPIYIAQTRDMHQRLEGHVTQDDAIANGATHIHIHYCTAGQAARCTEERDLILRWQPVCNDVIES